MHPQPTLIAGVAIDLGNTEFMLRGCHSCGFQFKDPPLPASKLLECYAKANSDQWELDPDPRQRKFDLLQRVVEKHSSGGRILDVGCFNGALLNYLSGQWKKFGVEPSQEAAQMARARGIEVLSSSLDELDTNLMPFDAVIVTDVVEHIVEPLPFFRQLSNLVAHGGMLLILTGDTGSLAWRLQKNAYWYCSLPEHVSFYNKSSLDHIGKRTGMQGAEYLRLSHNRTSLFARCTDIVKNAAYVVGRRARGFGMPILRRLFVDRRGPSVESAHDHLIYVYRKMK
jgi:SAM-dependent methyltransferase